MGDDRLGLPLDPKVTDLNRERQLRFWKTFMMSRDSDAMRRAAERFFGPRPTTPRRPTHDEDDQGPA